MMGELEGGTASQSNLTKANLVSEKQLFPSTKFPASSQFC